MITGQTRQLQGLLDRLAQGDETARELLLENACERLHLLARKMLGGYPGVRRWEESNDVLQNVLLRLHRALEKVQPATVCDFLQLAALQIRRECIDLARHYFGPRGLGANYVTPAGAWSNGIPCTDCPLESEIPERLAAWSEFHARVNALEPLNRQLFDLLWYQGLTQEEAALLLGVSLSTLKRRWQEARVRLYENLGGGLPL